jgi:hypothetical protein
MWSPGSRGLNLTKRSLSVTLAPFHTTRTSQQLLAEFQTPVDWPPYLSDLNPLDFTIWGILQAKVKAMPHTNLDSIALSITAEWDQLAAEYLLKICHSFYLRL